jgi:hypothetical protein
MKAIEYEIAAEMLNVAADEFGNHCCNDCQLSNTPEHLAFVHDMIATSDYPEEKPSISKDGSFIHSAYFVIMRYCQHLLEKEAEAETVERLREALELIYVLLDGLILATPSALEDIKRVAKNALKDSLRG